MERQKSISLKGRIAGRKHAQIKSRLALAERILGRKEFPPVRNEERARIAIREAKSLVFETSDDQVNVKKIGDLEKQLTRNRRNRRRLEHKMAFAKRIADNPERTDSEKEQAREALAEAKKVLKKIRNQIVDAIEIPGHIEIINLRDKKVREILCIEMELNKKPKKEEKQEPSGKIQHSFAGHQC